MFLPALSNNSTRNVHGGSSRSCFPAMSNSIGEPFSLAAIEQSRQNLLNLDLFHSVQMEFQQETGKPRPAPIRIRVAEKEPRSIRLGAGRKLSNLDIAGGTVGFGLSLPKGLRVSVAHDLTKKGERKVSLEYQLSPHWQIDTSSSSGGQRGPYFMAEEILMGAAFPYPHVLR